MVRLTTQMRAQALIRAVEVQGGFAAVVAKGDRERGALLVKHVRSTTAVLLLEFRSDGDRGEGLYPVTTHPETDGAVDDRISKRRRFDRDLWVIEIEDPTGTLDPERLYSLP